MGHLLAYVRIAVAEVSRPYRLCRCWRTSKCHQKDPSEKYKRLSIQDIPKRNQFMILLSTQNKIALTKSFEIKKQIVPEFLSRHSKLAVPKRGEGPLRCGHFSMLALPWCRRPARGIALLILELYFHNCHRSSALLFM